MSLSKLDDSVAVEILKIKAARSMAYFYNELAPLDVPIEEVLKDIGKIKKRFTLLKSLRFPDLFFFTFPKVYMLIDKIRLRNKKEKI